MSQLYQAKGRLLLAALCTLVITATELLKPWPLKLILDHIVLNKKLTHSLRTFSAVFQADKHTALIELAACIVLIALLGGLFSYAQIFLTSSIGYKLVYALR